MANKLTTLEILLENLAQRAKQDKRLRKLLTIGEITAVEQAADLLPLIHELLRQMDGDEFDLAR